ncbi:hypothetical protein P692DRAFT_201804670 [Suillus brevipes Sb2]|nr:hypothetical protein P692DRAFT_201804670 [Suillus brevipes Sb2]
MQPPSQVRRSHDPTYEYKQYEVQTNVVKRITISGRHKELLLRSITVPGPALPPVLENPSPLSVVARPVEFLPTLLALTRAETVSGVRSRGNRGVQVPRVQAMVALQSGGLNYTMTFRPFAYPQNLLILDSSNRLLGPGAPLLACPCHGKYRELEEWLLPVAPLHLVDIAVLDLRKYTTKRT